MINRFKNITFIFSLILVITLSSPCFGQETPPDQGGDPFASVPIDGGVGFLAAAGIAYGAKKIRDYRKQKNDPVE